ncbi:HNH endonuclease [Candidatus Obscuribacterales bacterium]|nr:HNH endonuclease [Candidatus Obscuribacterales bacterium]MBX3135654.1 HNH endonuclease [Candidatus Obscuribacterales bacterium]MBX3149231.1 HNH endonuclease [Candidatus Obscuribacterales bacterium]
MSKVLVLNASYEPLNICTWRRAVVLLLKGKAEQIEHNGKVIYMDTPLPTVIRLRHYVKIPYKEISLSRRNILHRDNYTCQYCGVRRPDLTIDHIIPRSRGGIDSWDNVAAACLKCNVKKGDRTPKEAGMLLRIVPRRPISHVHFEISKHTAVGESGWQKYVIG